MLEDHFIREIGPHPRSSTSNRSDPFVPPFCPLEQTSLTVYDAYSNVVSQTDGLNRVTTYAFNNVEQQTASSAGQTVPLVSGSATLPNLAQTPGNARTFTIYVEGSATSSGDTTITDSASGSPTFTYSGSSATPLGNGWYELGTVVLAASDTSTSLTVAYSGGGETNVSVVQQMSADSYTPTGLVSSETNGNGNISVSTYDAVYDPLTASLGQTAAFVSGSATLGNLPQAPGLGRTYTIYVQSTSAPTSGHTTITDSASGSPTFTFSGSSTTPLGSGWYELGTVVLAASDISTSVTVAYSGSGTVSTVALVEQTSSSVYDAIGRVTSTTDALGDTTAYNFDFGSDTDEVTTYTGQTVAMSSGSSVFNNLTLVPGSSRTYVIYVNSSTAPASGSGYTITDTAGTLTLTYSGSSTTPLGLSGSNWYELGTVTLISSDKSATVTVAYSGGATVTEVSLVMQSAQDTYNAVGNLTSSVDALGNSATYAYNDLELPKQQAVESEAVGLELAHRRCERVAVAGLDCAWQADAPIRHAW
jgi:YD repeat-containing protein